MKIAQFTSVKYEFTRCLDEEMAKACGDDYAQVSEWVDVQFTPLPKGEVVAAQIAGLDKIKEAVVTEYTQKLDAIDRRKAELLALPNLEAA